MLSDCQNVVKAAGESLKPPAPVEILARATKLMKTPVVLVGLMTSMSVSAAWITDAEMAGLEPKPVFARQLERNKLPKANPRYQNRHILFRRKFRLEDFTKAQMRITADDYYKLYVNGRFVAMGPAAGTPECTYFNTLDLTPYLVKGDNVLAVHTYYQGLVNRVWMSGDNRHGLWLELDADGRRVLESDDSFVTARHSGFASLGVTGYETQFLESYDAGAPEVGFECPAFDDSRWVKAIVHPRGGDYRLVEQPMEPVMTERIAPQEVKKLPDGRIFVDFGGVYVGNVEFVAQGPKGGTVEIYCGQELDKRGRVRYEMRSYCKYEERLVLSGWGAMSCRNTIIRVSATWNCSHPRARQSKRTRSDSSPATCHSN